jgi:hypothetical protein
MLVGNTFVHRLHSSTIGSHFAHRFHSSLIAVAARSSSSRLTSHRSIASHARHRFPRAFSTQPCYCTVCLLASSSCSLRQRHSALNIASRYSAPHAALQKKKQKNLTGCLGHRSSPFATKRHFRLNKT